MHSILSQSRYIQAIYNPCNRPSGAISKTVVLVKLV